MNILPFNVDKEYSANLMILTTEFSLMSPNWLGVNTLALLQILDFMSEPITAADGEEGLNNVPLL